QFVKPYVKSNKNDAVDAEAICEAVNRPSMRFVAIKTVEQQSVLSIHRAREGFVKSRTACANQIRGLLAEFGLVLPVGMNRIAEQVPILLDQATLRVPGPFIELIRTLVAHLKYLDKHVKQLECAIKRWHRNDALSQQV